MRTSVTPACRRLFTAAVLAALALPGIAAAASLEPGPMDLRAMRARADALRARAQEAVLPLAPGQTRILEAVVMETRGLVQWQPDENAPWKSAAVDDILKPGAVIRTGGKSKLFLRVGHNVTLLVDRMTVVTLPEFVHDGDTLRTEIALQRGIIDVKVDRVGPTNDVQILTPSTTLAVEGTGLSIRYGGLEGTHLAGARTNEMFAMEVRYFLSRYAYYLSGGATSSEDHQNPVIASLFQTFGPPLMLTALVEEGIDPELLDDTFERSSIYAERRADYGGPPPVEEAPMQPPPPPPLPCPEDVYAVFGEQAFANAGECAALAMQICDNLFRVFSEYNDLMMDSLDGPGVERLNELFVQLDEICDDLGGDEHDLADIARAVSAYCENHFQGRPDDIDTCKTNFRRAVNRRARP